MFDEFDKDRNKIFISIPKIIQKIKNINDDKTNNQSNLFENDENLNKEFEYLDAIPWTQKQLLNEEFKSLGFYVSDHPLNEYEEIFKELKIISYNQFYENNETEGLVAGTIMSIVEKKSAKGTPYGIVKLSDKREEFELFLFSEILTANREKLKESESFIITLQKDKFLTDTTKRRVNVRKILSLDEMINKPYERVEIELKDDFEINEVKKILAVAGETQISLIIKNKNKKARYLLQNNRKFDLTHLKALKAKKYVAKILV